MPDDIKLPPPFATLHDDGYWTMPRGAEFDKSNRAGWRREVYTADQLRAAVLADRESRWQPIETAPRDGTAFRGYHPELIDLDFNPAGSVECAFDGAQFIGCVWNGQQDAWYGKPVELTHWQPLPAPPEQEPTPPAQAGGTDGDGA